jgi:Phytoene/squalene synthetase
MEKDMKKVRMQSLANTLEYMYGSAEVIGLMIAKILKLPKKSYKYAKMLGRAMQYANMIRDIDEDNSLGRTYIPIEHIKKHGLTSLNKEDVLKNKEKFEKLIRYEIKFCRKWQSEAEKGFDYIPKRLLIPIRTSSDMYKWFTNEIYKNPLIVFEKKVKPSKTRIIMTAAKNAISLIGYK